MNGYDGIDVPPREARGHVGCEACLHARPIRQDALDRLADGLVESGPVRGQRRDVERPPCLRAGARHLQPREKHVGTFDHKTLRGVADLGHPDRLFAVAVFRHQPAEAFELHVQNPFGADRLGVGVDVHDVEGAGAALAVDVLDEVQRHAGRAAKRHEDGRIDALGRLVGAPQHREVVRRARTVPPVVRGILLVPDFNDRQTLPVVLHEPAHELRPFVEMVANRHGPRRRPVEDRQKLKALRLAFGHNLVVS
ncbi:MAG: hypothetical protein IJK04_13085 [Kiritimatiellae bacterium]|nr:hypothetical protein [Kiritimatiellia bacterium]